MCMKSAYMLDRFVQLKTPPNQFPASDNEIANWTDRVLGLDIKSIKGMTEGNSLAIAIQSRLRRQQFVQSLISSAYRTG